MRGKRFEIAVRVGLVDDDLCVRRALCRLLESQGYACVAYDSAEAALADPDLEHMDCLIVDIELLGMDGFDLRDRLLERGSPIPHVFITSHSEFDYHDWNRRMGNSSFLKKPVEKIQLISSIERLIDR